MKRGILIRKLRSIYMDRAMQLRHKYYDICIAPVHIDKSMKLCSSKSSWRARIIKDCNVIAFDCGYVTVDEDDAIFQAGRDRHFIGTSLRFEQCPLKLLEQIVQSLPFELKVQYDLMIAYE